ncbi:MAG: zinc ABC transporter substrate-binding protein [Planctomycetaceae bacterium]|nr:zinc ABC transporter substrate-binding protein [Planctomycetaceae bacterium]
MRVLCCWLWLSLACLGCAAESSETVPEPAGGDARYTIVTTTAMVTDIVQQVAGDRATVTGLMGTGVDPHLFRPSTSDHSKLLAADVIFYSGLMLEGGLDPVLKKARERGKPAFAVTEEIDPAYIRYSAEFEGHPDPHVWNDVAAWSECVAYVAEALAKYDPPHADEYAANAERYRAELAALHQYAQKVIASIPEEQRTLVTAHDAFEYFSRAYHIPVKSVLGITTESEAGVEDINSLVDFLVEHKIPAVFIETSVNSRNIEAVMEGAAKRDWQVKIGGTLFSDAMGAPGTYEGTYIGMLDHNATVVARALGGEAPERGFQGKLAATP